MSDLCWIIFPGLWLLGVINNYVDYLNEYLLLNAGYVFILIAYAIFAPLILAGLLTEFTKKRTP